VLVYPFLMGVNVDIWDMPLIPLMSDFKPRPNANLVALLPLCVADLILHGVRVWNKMILEDLFYSPSVECILSIYLSPISCFLINGFGLPLLLVSFQ
jgi:hypothetical protein